MCDVCVGIENYPVCVGCGFETPPSFMANKELCYGCVVGKLEDLVSESYSLVDDLCSYISKAAPNGSWWDGVGGLAEQADDLMARLWEYRRT